MRRFLTFILWIALAVAAAIAFGVANDQITVTISPEYYSVFKRAQFAPALMQIGLSDAPGRVIALIVGVLATWWYGVFLGIALGISGMVGRGVPISTGRYLLSLARVMIVTLGVSVVGGAAAYLSEPLLKPDPAHWPFLAGIQYVRPAFAVGWWHNFGYVGALVATVIESFRVQRERRAAS